MKQTAIVEKNMARRHKQLAKLALAAPGQVLILVPEIWLLEKVVAAFPPKTSVATMHAGRPLKKQFKIVIGTQKALWLPWQQLSLIIIEEEYYPTHKLWDQYPRLSNIDGAQALAVIWQADIVWSGSFASLRLYQAIGQNKIELVRSAPIWPRVKLIRTTYEDRRRGWLLPAAFIQELRAANRKKEKVVMLRNREGITGPEKIKALLKHIFGKQPDFLVETAALFTHLQDARVHKIVWLFPEDSLLYPDFRSAERAWYMLARLQQLTTPSRPIILVSRGQQADLVEKILGQKPEQFYEQQLAERARFGYPPWRDLVRLTVIAKTSAAAQTRAEKLRQAIAKDIPLEEAISLRGPFASFEKTRQPQWHLLLTGSLPRLTELYADHLVDRVDVSPERII